MSGQKRFLVIHCKTSQKTSQLRERKCLDLDKAVSLVSNQCQFYKSVGTYWKTRILHEYWHILWKVAYLEYWWVFLPWLNKCTVMKNSHSWSQECCYWILHVVFLHNSTELIMQNSAIQRSKGRLLDIHPHVISLSIFTRFLQNILSHLICQPDLLGDDISNLIWRVTVWVGRRLSIWKFWNLLPEEIRVLQFLAK